MQASYLFHLLSTVLLLPSLLTLDHDSVSRLRLYSSCSIQPLYVRVSMALGPVGKSVTCIFAWRYLVDFSA